MSDDAFLRGLAIIAGVVCVVYGHWVIGLILFFVALE
jgi:hypothetical protein